MHDKLRYAGALDDDHPRYYDVCRLIVAWARGHVTADECASYYLWLTMPRKSNGR